MRPDIDINSNDNALFVTAQCDNRCLMCSQPPLKHDDIDFFWNKNIEIIDNIPPELSELGITGGEPTILGNRFFELINYILSKHPDIYLHILTNGRRFSDKKFSDSWMDIPQKNLLLGIPLHSYYFRDHDIITQIAGSYDQTMKGLYNLGNHGLAIELRVVINKINYLRLPQMATFIYKNLPFVKYISLMGMEDTGYAIKNMKKVWVDPVEYKSYLEETVNILSGFGMNVSVFNLPHCILPVSIHEFACKSISDWKVKYFDDCSDCRKQLDCCGLFTTSRKQSAGLKPIY